MNPWLLAAIVLVFCLIPLGVVVLRGDPTDRVVGLEGVGMVCTMVIMLLAIAFERAALLDLALAASLLAFGGGLVFVRFLERWL